MKEKMENISDAMYPVHLFCKLAGYSPQTFRVSATLKEMVKIVKLLTSRDQKESIHRQE